MEGKWHQSSVSEKWCRPASQSLLAVFLINFPPLLRLRNASLLYLWSLVGLVFLAPHLFISLTVFCFFCFSRSLENTVCVILSFWYTPWYGNLHIQTMQERKDKLHWTVCRRICVLSLVTSTMLCVYVCHGQLPYLNLIPSSFFAIHTQGQKQAKKLVEILFLFFFFFFWVNMHIVHVWK